MTIAYKILTADEWAAFAAAGSFAGSAVDRADGFIHLSGEDTVVETAARHFAGQDALVLVMVDLAGLGPAVRWEVSRGGARFPHLYGALPLAAVTRTDRLKLDAAGHHVFPAGLG